MEERDIAIQIEGLRKRYRLGTIGGGTLRGDIESWWARKRGKEDPNSKIGAKQHVKNEIFYALDGIDLTVYKGERLGIIGHNGAGKSTLLKLLSRVTAPTEGKISLDGRVSSMLEVGTGFNAELTGRENIYLNGAILGMSKAEVDAKMEQIIDFSEVRQFIDTPVKRYSSGMFVKLAFSVAAHLDSEIIIMDEVLAVGDMTFQKKCLSKMSEVSQLEGRTVLYVSHNMNTIRQLCDRCIVLSAGKVIFNGGIEEAISIYMNENKVSQDKFLTYTDNERAPYIREQHSADIEKFELLNHSEYVFSSMEELFFAVQCKAHKDTKNVGIRLEFQHADGVTVGSQCIYDIADFESNKTYSHRFKISLSSFGPGIYNVNIVYFTINPHTLASLELDVILKAFSFEIIELDDEITWNSVYWGHIRLNSIEQIE